VLGVALFGSLIGQPDAFMHGAHLALAISVALLGIAAAVIRFGASREGRRMLESDH
jgi:DHA2 family methylenomycin A resistance protein-like MFS transporter